MDITVCAQGTAPRGTIAPHAEADAFDEWFATWLDDLAHLVPLLSTQPDGSPPVLDTGMDTSLKNVCHKGGPRNVC